jgi:hypothetical protein
VQWRLSSKTCRQSVNLRMSPAEETASNVAVETEASADASTLSAADSVTEITADSVTEITADSVTEITADFEMHTRGLTAVQGKRMLVLEHSIFPHRPLQCVVEESLSSKDVLLMTQVKPEGHGSKAGLQGGDVIVGVCNVFGDAIECVRGYSLEQL